MIASVATLLPLLAALFSLPAARAQDKSVQDYPQWVTNDYTCVIDCLKIFNESVKDRPSPATDLQATQCILNGCNKDTMGMNIYQSHYIIQASLIIYEDPNMGQWGQGIPPGQQPAPARDQNQQGSSSAAPPAQDGGAQPASSSPPAPAAGSPASTITPGGSAQKPSGTASATPSLSPGGNNSGTAGNAAGRAMSPVGFLPAALVAIVSGMSGAVLLPSI
ncbi:uncharacterized protein MKK02DRAFT_39568 [Dioszegia hungarica]|uniref:Extracellular membrane protein CFEM domain-containing protein n=1 Tax=Dioszegia hungarica TaxID=4972 RepID=A0AA38HDQ2_9TREE|nr:uncharacterized protein MKK02DRAFT_39568 [Dioszegia hungarica]KAI9639272.1 hypothetical protein MKK02DRAFT_39568 [Dioszegia hungarica]